MLCICAIKCAQCFTEYLICKKKNRTFLEVQEDGMGEATTSGLNRLGAFGEKYFEVDHPFIFFLWDYHSGILLFIGRITAPEPFIN